MQKPLILLLALSALALVSCGGGGDSSSSNISESSGESASSLPSSSSSSSELTKIEPSVELAAEKLGELKETTLIHYLLRQRSYQDSYIDGTVATNDIDTMEIHSYDGSFEGVETVEELTGIIETSVVSERSGRFAGYYLDEESFAYGYNWDDDHSSDHLDIYEVNRYLDPNAVEESLYSSLIDTVAAGFVDLDSVYPLAYGYSHSEPVIEEENGTFRITLGAYAPEEGYFGREENSVYCLLDAYTGEVVELGTTALIYDMGYVDPDPNVSANGITDNTIVIYETGERQEGTVEPIDESLIDPENINSAIPEKVEGLETGTLSEDSVLAILSNIAAYAEGVTRDDFTVETSGLTDLLTYDSLGAATGTGTASVEGDLYEESITYELADGTDVVQSMSNEATEEGVLVVASQDGTVVSNGTTPGIYVTSWASYFTPGPFTATGSVACSEFIVSDAVSHGFGTFGNDYSSGTQTLLEATNEGGTISIAFESSTTTSFGSTEVYLAFTIVDGILATVEGTNVQSFTFGDLSQTTTTSESHVLTAA